MRHLLIVPFFIGMAVAQDQPAPAPAAPPTDQSAPPAAASSTPDQTAAPAADSVISGSIELGYRFVSGPYGNQDVYRSTVNLGQGPRLVSFDFTVKPVKKLFDHFELQANSWGGDPYNSARLDVDKTGLYRLTADYRNTAYFNFLPSFADPTVSSGILLTQSSFDTHIR
ncbi:MAG TPA: hypothetical protein VMJ34_02040, partial [Bryobacteraceae bacterium]|nr:hypothetical protein [Bryobacteraceae bacterium]